MTKLEDVRKALELCRYDPDPYDDDQPCKLMVSCEICPYWDETCGCRETDLYNDALELLKVQEPQVLSVEAVRKLTQIPVWLDVKSTHKNLYRGWVLAYMVQKGMGITGERLGMTDPSGRMHWYKLDDYGRTWRVWDSIPTDTEKEAIPW